VLSCWALPTQAGPYEIGKAADSHGDYAVALKHWRPAAEQGQADAQNGLAVLYYYGHGVPEDWVEAEKWFRRSAAQGFAKAQGNLALMISDGRIKGSDAEAFHLAGLAAEQGNVYGQYVLGYYYYRGKNTVEIDYPRAFAALSLASAQGYAPAQADLGELYAYGLGTPENHARAYAWFKTARAQSRSDSAEAFALEVQLKSLVERSTVEEINAGQLLAERCIQSKYQDCGPR
jgi:TPR repeat protein